jgi:nicotinamidase-related amidase
MPHTRIWKILWEFYVPSKSWAPSSREVREADTIPQLTSYGERIITVEGKDGFNAFAHTRLGRLLQGREIEDIVLAGAVHLYRLHRTVGPRARLWRPYPVGLHLCPNEI